MRFTALCEVYILDTLVVYGKACRPSETGCSISQKIRDTDNGGVINWEAWRQPLSGRKLVARLLTSEFRIRTISTRPSPDMSAR
ncbi:hypothetical protein HYQ46_010967 [Verticillium longisporum]|nr:hypothetical protein HYQ46_010967 [Verticillium longisporum]